MKGQLSQSSGSLFPKIASKEYPINLTVFGVVVCIVAAVCTAFAAGGTGFDAVSYVLTIENFPNAKEQPLKRQWADVFMGLAAAWTILVFVFSMVKDKLRGYWYRWTASQHTVICGVGWQGRSYIVNRYHQYPGQPTIAIELSADDAAAMFCKQYGAYLVSGNANRYQDLKAAAVHKARAVYVCSGNQDENLLIAQHIKKFVDEHRAKEYDPLQVFVSLGSELTDSSNAESMFSSIVESTDRCAINFYDPDRRMARIFFYRHKVYQWVSEGVAGAQGKRRVHIVFLSFSRLVGELILQYSRIWPCADHMPPLFTIICQNDKRANAFLRAHPILDINSDWRKSWFFGDFNADDFPGQVIVHNRGEDDDLLSVDLMRQIETGSTDGAVRSAAPAYAPVTAVICSHDDTQTALQRAGQCRLLSQRSGLWLVPVLVEVEKQTGTAATLNIVQQGDQYLPGEIIPFGSALEYCDLKLLESMEALARGIHDDYVSNLRSALSSLPANKPWNKLEHRFQESNYRAADHVLMKLFSAGFRWRGLMPSIGAAESLVSHRDELAELEHRSWLAEKLVAGYRKGRGDERDDSRLIHKDVVAWSNLTQDDRRKDLNQVKKVARLLQLKSGTPAAAKRIVIGLVGRMDISVLQDADIKQWLKSNLESIIAQHSGSGSKTQPPSDGEQWIWLDFVCSLRAGSDCCLADAVLDFFACPIYRDRSEFVNRPVAGCRLIIPEFEQSSSMDHALKKRFFHRSLMLEPSSPDNPSHPSNLPHDINDDDRWKIFQDAIQVKRNRIRQRFEHPDRYQLLSALNESDSSGRERENSANLTVEDYFASHCDVLMAVFNSHMQSSTPDDEGVQRLVQCWRERRCAEVVKSSLNEFDLAKKAGGRR